MIKIHTLYYITGLFEYLYKCCRWNKVLQYGKKFYLNKQTLEKNLRRSIVTEVHEKCIKLLFYFIFSLLIVFSVFQICVISRFLRKVLILIVVTPRFHKITFGLKNLRRWQSQSNEHLLRCSISFFKIEMFLYDKWFVSYWILMPNGSRNLCWNEIK